MNLILVSNTQEGDSLKEKVAEYFIQKLGFVNTSTEQFSLDEIREDAIMSDVFSTTEALLIQKAGGLLILIEPISNFLGNLREKADFIINNFDEELFNKIYGSFEEQKPPGKILTLVPKPAQTKPIPYLYKEIKEALDIIQQAAERGEFCDFIFVATPSQDIYGCMVKYVPGPRATIKMIGNLDLAKKLIIDRTIEYK